MNISRACGFAVVAALIVACKANVVPAPEPDARRANARVEAEEPWVQCRPLADDAPADDVARPSPRSTKVEWIPRPHPDLAGFKLYWGSTPRDYQYVRDVGMTSLCRVGSLPAGAIYFSVTAYDKRGHETGFSNEVIVEIDE